MKDENKKLNKIISDLKNEKNKNEIEIIFSDDNKDYPLKIKLNKEESIDKVIEYISKNHQELIKDKYIKKIKTNDKEIDIGETIDKETNLLTDTNFHHKID